MTTLNQLLYGIRKEESGGNYHVVNSIGAVGAYQVMKANIPSWTKAALGYSMTWQQFRDSPSAQDAVARHILGGYYKKYGAAGAASMWFSGQPNPNKQGSDGSTTIRHYVDNVISLSGGGSIGGSSSSGGSDGSSGSTGGNQVPMSKGETAESYGYVQSLFDAVPELKKLFDKAVKGQWSSSKFQASIRDTKWWKGHSQQERDYLTKTYGDPATAKQQFSSAYIHVQQLAGTLGIQASDQTKKLLNAWAYNVAAKGWSDDQLRYEMGKHVYFDHGTWNGQGGEEQAKLHDYAYTMGVTMSNTWYSGASRNIVRGVRAEQDFMSDIRKQSKSLFPNWSKQIDAGQTVADLANPYLTSMQQILELPGGSINLFDPTVKKALQYKDPTTGQGTAKPLWQFENELRGDPRWKKTKNAQDSLMQVAHQVLSDFGMKY